MLILETLLRNLRRVYMYTSMVLVMIMADIGKGHHYSVDWTTGLDYWTGLLGWTTGLTETTSGGERNKTIPRFDTAIQERRGYLASLPACSARYSVRSWCKCAFLFKIGAVILTQQNPMF